MCVTWFRYCFYQHHVHMALCSKTSKTAMNTLFPSPFWPKLIFAFVVRGSPLLAGLVRIPIIGFTPRDTGILGPK